MAGYNRKTNQPVSSKKSIDPHQRLKNAIKNLNNLRSIIDRSPAVVFLWKAEEGWPIEYVSKSIHQFGYSDEDFLSGRVSWVGITHPDDVPRLEKEIEHYSREGIRDFAQEYRLITRSGDIRWIEDRTMAVLDKKGTTTHYQGIILDVTERKTAENELSRQQEKLEELVEKRTARLREANQQLQKEITERIQTEDLLRESERFLDNVFSSIQDGISLLDNDMNIIRVNPAMEFWYVHALPLIGKKCYQAYHGRNERCDSCPTYRTLETGNVSFDIVPKTGPDGIVVGWQDLYAFPLIDPQTQKILGAIEYVRDITNRKKIEEKLLTSESTIRALLNATDDAMFLIDTKGTLLALNGTLTARLSKTTEELLGKCIYDYLPPNVANPRKHHVEHVVRSGKAIHFEDTRNGIWLENFIYPISNKHGNVTMLAICSRNITERKLSEQEREKLIERLQEYIGQIRTLGGLIPICSSCKRVRGDEGYWSQLEVFISEHFDMEFSHGLCPECAKKLYPGY